MKSFFKKTIFFTLVLTGSTQLSAMNNIHELREARDRLEANNRPGLRNIINSIIQRTQELSRLRNNRNNLTTQIQQVENGSDEYNRLNEQISNNTRQSLRLRTNIHNLQRIFFLSYLPTLARDTQERKDHTLRIIMYTLAAVSICSNLLELWDKKSDQKKEKLEKKKTENKTQTKTA